MRLIALFCLASLLLPFVLGAQGADFKVIVCPSNPVNSISSDHLSKLFLKKNTQWEDGTRALPVDQVEQSQVRQVFTRNIHRKDVAAVKSYWQQQVFSGRSVPPPEKTSDAEVIAYVRSNPGAIGYVSGEAAADGVKVIRVVD